MSDALNRKIPKQTNTVYIHILLELKKLSITRNSREIKGEKIMQTVANNDLSPLTFNEKQRQSKNPVLLIHKQNYHYF